MSIRRATPASSSEPPTLVRIRGRDTSAWRRSVRFASYRTRIRFAPFSRRRLAVDSHHRTAAFGCCPLHLADSNAVVAFTAHHVIAADVEPDETLAHLPSPDLGAPVNAEFLACCIAAWGVRPAAKTSCLVHPVFSAQASTGCFVRRGGGPTTGWTEPSDTGRACPSTRTQMRPRSWFWAAVWRAGERSVWRSTRRRGDEDSGDAWFSPRARWSRGENPFSPRWRRATPHRSERSSPPGSRQSAARCCSSEAGRVDQAGATGSSDRGVASGAQDLPHGIGEQSRKRTPRDVPRACASHPSGSAGTAPNAKSPRPPVEMASVSRLREGA